MATMRLIEMRGGYLYQHRPDIIQADHLVDEELALWALFYERRAREMKNG
jgi:hypothetical protein